MLIFTPADLSNFGSPPLGLLSQSIVKYKEHTLEY